MSYQDIIYTKQDHIATITINRPERMNALSWRTHQELAQAMQELKQDEDVRVLVVTGTGRGFCSGDDVGDIFLGEGGVAGRVEEERMRRFETLQGKLRHGGLDELLSLNIPSIAAVNGPAVGYGCDITLMCDMRIASEKAKFGEVFLRVGLIPDQGLILLPRLVGLAKAYELLLTADIIDAREAERIGLVNKLVPHEELEQATMELASKLAKMPPLAVRLVKEGIRRGLALPLQSFMEFQVQALDFCAQTEDHVEGARAFMEKREPQFKGK